MPKRSPLSCEDQVLIQDLSERGFHILPSRLSQPSLGRVIDCLKQQRLRRTPLNDTDHSHWWDEVDCPANTIAAQHLFTERVKERVSQIWGPPSLCVFWANVYRAGERIPRHRDTEGELQIITALSIPPHACGGALIIHHQQSHEVLLSPGDQLIFSASTTDHETSVLSGTADCPNPIRAVGVCRLFFSAAENGSVANSSLT